MLYRAKLVEDMHRCEPGMTKCHAWSGVAHDDAGFFSLALFVAMNGATGTGWFGLFVGTLFQASLGIGQKLTTLITVRACFRNMVVGAVDSDHSFHGAKFPRKSFRQVCHER